MAAGAAEQHVRLQHGAAAAHAGQGGVLHGVLALRAGAARAPGAARRSLRGGGGEAPPAPGPEEGAEEEEEVDSRVQQLVIQYHRLKNCINHVLLMIPVLYINCLDTF